MFELKRLKEEAIRKEQEAIQKEKERQIEIQRLKEVAVSKFVVSISIPPSTCFIVLVTYLLSLKHPNKSFFNPINIYRLTSKYFRFKKKRKDKLNY